MGFVIQKFMEWKIQAQSLSNSFPDNVSSIYRRSHDLIIGGSIATINFTRSFPPFLPTLLSFLFFFPSFSVGPGNELERISLEMEKTSFDRHKEQASYRGFVTKQRGGNFCGWLCGINEKSRRWSKDEDLNFFFFVWQKENMEEKANDEFLDLIIIERIAKCFDRRSIIFSGGEIWNILNFYNISSRRKIFRFLCNNVEENIDIKI